MRRPVIFLICGIMLAATILAISIRSRAGYPMISGLSNKYLSPGQSTGVMTFQVQDDRTGAASLTVDCSSDNQDLVPDGNIDCGGSGSNRTVVVTPVPGRTGTATITVRVTDTDGETGEDTFQIEVVAAPSI